MSGTISKETLVNQIVKAAQDLPSLLKGLASVDPTLLSQLQGKSLVASKTPWATLIATAVAWTSTKYALGWNDATDGVVTGAVLLAVSYGMRAITSAPINGILPMKPSVSIPGAKKGLFALAALAALGAVGSLAACSTTSTEQTVAALGEALTASDQAAITYVHLPLCPANAPLCSKAATSDAIKKASETAYTSYKVFEAAPTAVGALAAAEQALAAYAATIPTAGSGTVK